MAYCGLTCLELAPLCAKLAAREECPCEGVQPTHPAAGRTEESCRAQLSFPTPYPSEARDHCLLASLCAQRCAAYTTPDYCACATPGVSGA